MLRITYSIADQNFQTTKSVGIFNVSTRLLDEMARDSRVEQMTVLGNHTLGLDLPNRVHVQHHNAAVAGKLRRMWWDQLGVYGAAKKLAHEWLLLPKGFASFLRRCPVKLAVYSHDTIMQSYYASRPGMPKLEQAYFGRAFRASLRQSQVIFTNSDFTCREIRRVAVRWGLQTPRLVNVGIGFTAPPLPDGEADRPRVMVLASNQPHKRTDLAVQYLERWHQETEFTGEIHWVGKWPDRLEKPQRQNWKYSWRLPEGGYRTAVQESQALVFFSEYEGFGMPPVEAALAGVCPVYSELESTREVMTGMGCAFRNESYESFAAALNTALKVPRSECLAWRERFLQRFRWSQVSDRVIAALLEG